MLKEAARIGEEDLRENLERIKEFLAPLLLLVAAVVIGIVVCVVLGPLFEMLSAMPEHQLEDGYEFTWTKRLYPPLKL